MRIAIASDHAAFALKASWPRGCASGHEVGIWPRQRRRVDYPDYGYVSPSGRGWRGRARIALCGSGIGISIAVNRNPRCRCALVSEPLSAALAREHNDANGSRMGAR